MQTSKLPELIGRDRVFYNTLILKKDTSHDKENAIDESCIRQTNEIPRDIRGLAVNIVSTIKK